MNVAEHHPNTSKEQSRCVVKVNIKKIVKTEKEREERRSKWREYKRRYRENKRKRASTQSTASPKVPVRVKNSDPNPIENTESKKVRMPVKKILRKDSKIETLRLKWRINKRKYRERKKNKHSDLPSMIVEGNAIFFVEDVGKNDSIFIEESDHEFEKNHFSNSIYQSNQGIYHEPENTFNLTETDNDETELVEIRSDPLEFVEV